MLEFSQFLINNFAYIILHLYGNPVTIICDGTRPQSVNKLNEGIYRQSPVKSPDIKNIMVVTLTFLLATPYIFAY